MAWQREANLCVQTDSPNVVKALGALFYSEFDETLSPDRKKEFKRVAESQLLVCPLCEPLLLAELKDAKDLTLRVAGFGDLPNIERRLLELAPRLRILLPVSYQGHHPLEDRLRRAGAQVRFVDEFFDGLVCSYKTGAGEVRAIIGSMQLNADSLGRSREVGIVLKRDSAAEVATMLNSAWQQGR
jgi:hypothetical protein